MIILVYKNHIENITFLVTQVENIIFQMILTEIGTCRNVFNAEQILLKSRYFVIHC